MQNLTKYERARLIGARALQIAMGSPFLAKFSKKDLDSFQYNPIEIAKAEFEKGVIPIDVKPTMPCEKRQQKMNVQPSVGKALEKEE